MTSVTLSVICKDEINEIDRIIHNYKDYFNEIHFAIDNQKVFDDCVIAYKDFRNTKFFKYEWINDFSDKRNWLAEKVKTDYYFTIDTDDVILYPEVIKEVIDEAKANNYAIVYGYYIYSTDANGNTNAAHWKERLIKNSKNLKWFKKIHENVVPLSTAGHSFNLDDRLKVKHNKSHEDIEKSNERNLKFLVDEYNQDKEKTDPRTIAYLGRVFLGLGDFKKARFFLEKHIELSGWDEDRYLSWCQLSSLHRLNKDYDQAIACAFEALEERPDYPDAYLTLHNIYFDREMWEKSIHWGEQGIKKEPPRNFIVVDPSSYTWRPALSLSYCYYNLGDFEKAIRLFNYSKKLAPTVPFIKENEQAYIEGVEHTRYIDNLLWLVNYTADKDKKKVKNLIESIPQQLFENQTISLLRSQYLEPKIWGIDSIVIYCGLTPEEWNPESIDKGIGGSEEATIQMSKELAKLGYKVTVYNTCSKEGVWDGVEYLNHVRFNPKDYFNILIGWRNNPFSYGIQASKKIIWVHDLPLFPFSEDYVKQFDKIVMLSKYHASLLPEIVPRDKVYISTNGLVPEDYIGLENIKREPQRIIYASSYNRGLEKILLNWEEIKKSCPEAEIHCYYGWDVYDKYLHAGLLKEDGWKAKMLELMKQPGVFEHGRIGHKELLKEYAKASIMAYPCTYTGEINCLALSKAIACGCYPLTNDFAVLPERNTKGKVVQDDKFIPALITLLRKGDTQIDNKGYIESLSWASVALDWHKNLFPNEVETIVRDRVSWSHAQLDDNKTIVDIGSNKGHIFEDWDRAKITSVDIDDYELPNFVRANAESLPFEDKKFDQACLFEIVEHAKNPIKVLSEARRVASKVIITVPYEYEWVSELRPFNTLEAELKRTGNTDVIEMVRPLNPAKDFYMEDGGSHLYHETYYDPELLRDHLTQAGYKSFNIVKIRSGKWAWLGAICEG